MASYAMGTSTIIGGKMLRSNVRVLTLGLCLAVLGMHSAGQPGASFGTGEPPAAAEDVTGTGWKTFVACVGCLAAGIGIASGGVPAIVVAASVPGSTLALAGCIAACANL